MSLKTRILNSGVNTMQGVSYLFPVFVRSVGIFFVTNQVDISADVTQMLRDTHVSMSSHATLPETRTRYPEAPATPATHLAPLISVHW